MTLKHLARTALVILAICIAPKTATASESEEMAALKAAQAWLAVVDAGNYEASWEATAGYFRGAVTMEQWVQAMEGIRRPLGTVRSRALERKMFATQLPGAPDGEYVVIQFNTVFENKQTAVETVTPVLEADGRWLVAGYFIN